MRNLRAVRKALNPFLVADVSMEMAAAMPSRFPTLTSQDLLIFGCELVKVYTSARWHDISNLDVTKMLLTDRYWGGPGAFTCT